jgi:hypothetical protein
VCLTSNVGRLVEVLILHPADRDGANPCTGCMGVTQLRLQVPKGTLLIVWLQGKRIV